MTQAAITMRQHEVERIHVIQRTVDTRGGKRWRPGSWG